jgi:hypothetical protein
MAPQISGELGHSLLANPGGEERVDALDLSRNGANTKGHGLAANSACRAEPLSSPWRDIGAGERANARAAAHANVCIESTVMIEQVMRW